VLVCVYARARVCVRACLLLENGSKDLYKIGMLISSGWKNILERSELQKNVRS
jgi:hypothetical protein